jgi:CheY-like chemotaxis protein
MSHEMRTPLNGVIGMLGLLSRTRMDGAQKAYLSAARDSAEHLLTLVNDLLDFARLDAGKLELESSPVDLERLCQGVAELLSPKAHDKGLDIAWWVAPDAPDVMADDGRLRQILFNLAGNAVKFTETGGVRIAVERAGGTDARPKLRFTVDDSGPGVPKEARARVFEEFGHVDPSDATKHGGAGLGLAVVRRLALAMGGVATVGTAPEPFGGARFTFEAAFPCAGPVHRTAELEEVKLAVRSHRAVVAEATGAVALSAGAALTGEDEADLVLIDHDPSKTVLAQKPAKARALVLLEPNQRDLIARYRCIGYDGYLIKPLRRASLVERTLAALGRTAPGRAARDDERIATLQSSGLRVLLAEDNPVNALLCKSLLKREGCVVETCGTGGEVLAACARARYDLILMDMRMPGMDGPTAARALRARGDATPIVALTANAFVEDRQACLAAGMEDFLTKPIEPDVLRSALGRWTNRDGRVRLAS